jgi:hypothetical protein
MQTDPFITEDIMLETVRYQQARAAIYVIAHVACTGEQQDKLLDELQQIELDGMTEGWSNKELLSGLLREVYDSVALTVEEK